MTIRMFTVLTLLSGFGFAQSVEIAVWDLLAGGDGVRFQQLVDEFNESQSGVTVNRTTLEWGTPFYTKVRTATVAGQQPDVVTYHVSRLIDSVLNDLLRPISDAELASVGLARDSFNTSLVERATFGGELYAVPLDTPPIVLYYNRDLLEQAGLLGEDGLPTGIDSAKGFTDALRQVNEATGAFGVVPPNYWRVWYSFFVQQGGELIADGQVQVGEEGTRALQLMADWVAEGLAPNDIDYAAGTAIFTGGQAAFMLNGVWEVPTLVDANEGGSLPFDYGVMPLPQLFDNALTWADSTALAIPQSQKGPITEEKLNAALEFIAYVQKTA